jgi:hypothetical protein
MVRLARRGNEVGFSGGNVMRMDVQLLRLSAAAASRGPGRRLRQSIDGPAANPRPQARRQSSARRRAGAGRRCASR